MPAEDTMERSGIAPDQKTAIIAGGAAGDHTVTGIRLGEVLISVWEQDGTSGLLVDRTAEYTISADNVINNTGGTTSASDFLVVQWFAKSAFLAV